MLGSDYYECIVKKEDSSVRAFAVLICGSLLTLATVILAFYRGFFLILLLSIALGAGTWFLWTRQQVEYEYILFGDELRVTKIIAAAKRKPLITVSLPQITGFSSLAESNPSTEQVTTVVACSAQDASAYCADLDHPEYGRTRLIFTPNEPMLAYLEKHLPRSVGFHMHS